MQMILILKTFIQLHMDLMVKIQSIIILNVTHIGYIYEVPIVKVNSSDQAQNLDFQMRLYILKTYFFF